MLQPFHKGQLSEIKILLPNQYSYWYSKLQCDCVRALQGMKLLGKNRLRLHNSLFFVQCNSAKAQIIMIIKWIHKQIFESLNLVVKIKMIYLLQLTWALFWAISLFLLPFFYYLVKLF